MKYHLFVEKLICYPQCLTTKSHLCAIESRARHSMWKCGPVFTYLANYCALSVICSYGLVGKIAQIAHLILFFLSWACSERSKDKTREWLSSPPQRRLAKPGIGRTWSLTALSINWEFMLPDEAGLCATARRVISERCGLSRWHTRAHRDMLFFFFLPFPHFLFFFKPEITENLRLLHQLYPSAKTSDYIVRMTLFSSSAATLIYPTLQRLNGLDDISKGTHMCACFSL